MESDLIYQVFQRNNLTDRFTDCKKYVDILRNPEVKCPSYIEHAVYSIIDTVLGMPDGNIEKIRKSKQLESDIRRIVKW